MIIDTCFFIDLMNEEVDAIQKFADLDFSGISMFCSTISIFELYQGKGILTNYQKESKKIEKVISQTEILSFDKEASKTAGIITANLKNQGNLIGRMDSMIAGVALSNNLPILTRNIKDFNRVPNLRLESY